MKANYFLGFSVAVLAVLISACSSMPGTIGENTSSFDGSTELTMQPAFIYRNTGGFSGSDMQASLHWRSSMPLDELVLTIYIDGATNIPSRDSLQFNVEGQFYEFSSIDVLTDISTDPGVYGSWATVSARNVSSKQYLMSESFVNNILNADPVYVRLNVGTGGYVEGIFSNSTISAARPAFSEFMRKRETHLNR